MKAISIDLDGTLLSAHMHVSEKNLHMIKKAQQNGFLVLLNTGRSFEEISLIPELSELQTPRICMNGTQIYNEKGVLLDEVFLKKEDYKTAIDIFKKHGIYTETVTNHHLYAETKKVHTAFPDVRSIRIKPYDELLADESHIFYKIISTSETPSLLYRAMEDIQAATKLSIAFPHEEWMEVTANQATKGAALLRYQSIEKCSFTDLYAIGDAGNDLSQFEVSTVSFAMENGFPDVKEKATYITKHNEEDGVAHAIEQILSFHSIQ